MDKHSSVGSQYGITGFPTIKIFSSDKKKPKDYQSARSAQAIVQAAMKETGEYQGCEYRIQWYSPNNNGSIAISPICKQIWSKNHYSVGTSGGASLPLLVGHKCVTGGALAIKLGHTYINEVGHMPHLAPPSRRLWLEPNN